MRGRIIFAIGVALIFGGGGAFAQTAIHVGANVQVSKAHEKYSMGEIWLSADPVDANHLMGCGIVYAENENRRWTTVYVSNDGGKSWASTLETKTFIDSADPACALGLDGEAAHIAIGVVDKKHYGLGVYHSSDGGKTWTRSDDLPMKFQGIDRESMVIDTTPGKFRNRVYITGESSVRDLGDTNPGKNGFAVWRSRDGGATFEGPAKRETVPNHYILQPGNSVVLSDGSIVSVFGDLKNSDGMSVASNDPDHSNALLESATIGDGGDTFSTAVKIDDWYMGWGRGENGLTALGMPNLAVDPGNGPFKDSLYVTWADDREQRTEIRFAYSRDKGKTWSNSVVLDEPPTTVAAEKEPGSFLPVVAVNKAGAVLLCWYDRRDQGGKLGWNLRARASLDGGETWTPSVKISEQANTFSPTQHLFSFAGSSRSGDGQSGSFDGPSDLRDAGEFGVAARADDTDEDKEKEKAEAEANPKATHITVAFQGRQFYAGDYEGLAADAGGTFHTFWIDNRTGLAQIWTAAINVDGGAVRNGSPDLAGLKDASDDVAVKVVSSDLDRAANTVTLGVQLKNTSKSTIEGPVKLRLVNLISTLGRAAASNADNHAADAGALWDVSQFLKDNALRPDETTAVAKLIFRVEPTRDFWTGEELRYKVLDFDVRVLAREIQPPPSGHPKDGGQK
jgi:hypothetical protein